MSWPGKRRHVGLRRHAGGEDELLRTQDDLLAVALDGDGPFLPGLVPLGLLRRGRAPVGELHDLGVPLEPVADLVLGREHRPVVREGDVGQVVVPDRVVQAERLVALAPAVARPLVLLDDDRRHAELAQARSEADRTLAAADDDDIGLGRGAERLGFLGALLLPGLAVAPVPVLGAHRTARAVRLLEALELGEGGEQRPDQPVLEADVARAATCRRLEDDPAFDDVAACRRRLGRVEAEAGGADLAELALEHGADLVRALQRLDVPGEGDEVAPVAVRLEEGGRGGGVALLERVVQPSEDGVEGCGRGLVEHGVSSGGPWFAARVGCCARRSSPAGRCPPGG